jgi:hypothetical protein
MGKSFGNRSASFLLFVATAASVEEKIGSLTYLNSFHQPFQTDISKFALNTHLRVDV